MKCHRRQDAANSPGRLFKHEHNISTVYIEIMMTADETVAAVIRLVFWWNFKYSSWTYWTTAHSLNRTGHTRMWTQSSSTVSLCHFPRLHESELHCLERHIWHNNNHRHWNTLRVFIQLPVRPDSRSSVRFILISTFSFVTENKLSRDNTRVSLCGRSCDLQCLLINGVLCECWSDCGGGRLWKSVCAREKKLTLN